MEKTTALLIALSVLLTATAAVSSARGMDEVKSFTVGEDTYYLTPSGQLYEETNGCVHLQKDISDCDDDPEQDDRDERVHI